MDGSSCCPGGYCKWSKKLAPLFLRLGIALVFIPAGWSKVVEYSASSQMVAEMGSVVVWPWLAMVVGYVLPILELYVGVAVLLGFGKMFTKGLTTLLALILVVFFLLSGTMPDGTVIIWYGPMLNATFWYLAAALALNGYGFGCLSIDMLIWGKGCCSGGSCEEKEMMDSCCGGGCHK